MPFGKCIDFIMMSESELLNQGNTVYSTCTVGTSTTAKFGRTTSCDRLQRVLVLPYISLQIVCCQQKTPILQGVDGKWPFDDIMSAVLCPKVHSTVTSFLTFFWLF